MISLNRRFASNTSVDLDDVVQMKSSLGRLGYYSSPQNVGITDIPDFEIFSALRSFQSDKGFRATGIASPNDETIEALNNDIDKEELPPPPTLMIPGTNIPDEGKPEDDTGGGLYDPSKNPTDVGVPLTPATSPNPDIDPRMPNPIPSLGSTFPVYWDI